MTAGEINRYFLSLADWVNPASTVDKVIMGDPDKPVQRILVTWMISPYTVAYAAKNGFDMIMTHEPTLYSHADELGALETKLPPEMRATARLKRDSILSAGLAVVRNHDVWDFFPDVGVPYAFAKALGIPGRPAAVIPYHHRYDIAPASAGSLASGFAGYAASVGEHAIELFGDPAAVVTKLGIGTGCGCDIAKFISIGCDAAVVCDDGSCYWNKISFAKDAGFPVIRMAHHTTEEASMVTLTAFIKEKLGIYAELFLHRQMKTIYTAR